MRVHSSEIVPGSGQPIPKGDGSLSQRRRSAKTTRVEKLRKAESKIRDGHRCRYPGCPVQGVGRVDSMHRENKGMGGDHGTKSATTADLLTGCRNHHQGPRSVHSGHLRFRPLTSAGCDGPVAWDRRETLDAPWRHVGGTSPLFPIPSPR